MGLGVSDSVSVGHIFAFLSSHYTFSSRARILRCQSRRLVESRIYHSPPLLRRNRLFYVLFKTKKVFLMLVYLIQKVILTSFIDFIRSSRRLCLQHECRHKILFNKYCYQNNSKRYDRSTVFAVFIKIKNKNATFITICRFYILRPVIKTVSLLPCRIKLSGVW